LGAYESPRGQIFDRNRSEWTERPRWFPSLAISTLNGEFAVEGQPGDIVVALVWMRKTSLAVEVDSSQTRAWVEAKQDHFRGL
jgi:hypothetical protein